MKSGSPIARSYLDQTLQDYIGGNQRAQNSIAQQQQNIDPDQSYGDAFQNELMAGSSRPAGTFGETLGNAGKAASIAQKNSENSIQDHELAQNALREKMVNTIMTVEQYKDNRQNATRGLDLQEKKMWLSNDLGNRTLGENQRHHSAQEMLGAAKNAMQNQDSSFKHVDNELNSVIGRGNEALHAYQVLSNISGNKKLNSKEIQNLLPTVSEKYRPKMDATSLGGFFGGGFDSNSLDPIMIEAKRDMYISRYAHDLVKSGVNKPEAYDLIKKYQGRIANLISEKDLEKADVAMRTGTGD